MPSWSDDLCPASVRCAPAAVTSGWQVTHRCSPGERLYMQPREFVPAGAKLSNLILTEPALCWVAMAAAPSTKTALLAAAHTFVPKPVACTLGSTSQISSSASKLLMSVSEAAAPAPSNQQSVTPLRKGDLKVPRNPGPVSDWPRTASSVTRTLRLRWQAGAVSRSRLPGAQNPL